MQRNVTKAAAALALLLILSLCLPWAGDRLSQWKEDHSGIPDAVSSRNSGRECFLTVVANRDEIEDKEEFARTVVEMCIENRFESMCLSTDQEGYPSRLEIEVYRRKSEAGRGEPVCLIRFEPTEEECNIKDDTEKYRLYVDGREIKSFGA